MSAITITGELGTGVEEVGKLIAEKLKYEYIGREIKAIVADELKRPQEDLLQKEAFVDNFLYNFSIALLRSNISDIVGLRPEDIPLDDSEYLSGLKSVIINIARSRNIVICEWGSQFILREIPSCLHILLMAPLGIRVRRLNKEFGLKEKDAIREIQHLDSRHNAFIKRYFRADFRNPLHYDVVINTRYFDRERIISIVTAAKCAGLL